MSSRLSAHARYACFSCDGISNSTLTNRSKAVEFPKGEGIANTTRVEINSADTSWFRSYGDIVAASVRNSILTENYVNHTPRPISAMGLF